MKLIRKTLTGTEYWNPKEKRTVFYPRGKEPKQENKKEEQLPVVDLDSMNFDELLAFAKENNIDIPGNMKKEETIRKHIAAENLKVNNEH